MNISTLTELEELIQRTIGKRKPLVLDPPEFRHSAVLMPIFSEGDTIKFILTKRAESLKHHKGEISFPGGGQEKEDEDLVETALRETEEEVGVKREQIKVLGRIDDLFTITRYIITPFVGIIYENVECCSNDAEVAELLYVPLDLFLSNEKFHEKSWIRNGTNYPLYYYFWKDYEIWGRRRILLTNLLRSSSTFNHLKLILNEMTPV